MVRQSERQTLLLELQQLIAIAAATEPTNNGDDEDNSWEPTMSLSFSLELYAAVLSHRYLNARCPVLKLPCPVEYILSLDAKRFRQEARMDKSSSVQIVSRIETHPIFSTATNNCQAPVHVQLLVLLAKLGRFGNGASVGILARFFGVSEEPLTCSVSDVFLQYYPWNIRSFTGPTKKKEMPQRVEF
ncbi:hypothetical protein LEN26_009113 [Aphanomyces euteiches]|nr:hypothetical protein LEN26_009113 [Aphanomyces euteiches]